VKHLIKKREFNRDSQQRKALMKTMLGSLILHEKIKTTEAKAKTLKDNIDRIISQAKKKSVKELLIKLPRAAVRKLTGDFIKNFEGRKTGFGRVIRLAPRKSDGARMAIIELVKS
jgi:large subunit ribosomal protein L17